MLLAPELYLIPGSDFIQKSIVRDSTGSPVNLTGFPVSISEASAGVTGLSITITNAVAGEVQLSIPWNAGWAITPGLIGYFRIAISDYDTYLCKLLVPPATSLIEIARGSQASYTFIWPDDNEGANLTGDTIALLNVSAALSGSLSVSVIDLALRSCRVIISGTPLLAVGDAGTFQIKRTNSTKNTALSPIRVRVK